MMDVQRKLGILAGAAKYDASRASSGVAKRGSLCASPRKRPHATQPDLFAGP
ncbi:MAG TPA: hypothetical protein PK880_03465 [Candidatus Competibacter sp.]|nr:hypothetical protein [Candidatus Competibacter sp.]